MRRAWMRLALGVVLIALPVACVTTEPRSVAGLASATGEAKLDLPSGARVLVLPEDVECGEVTVGGAVEPRPGWTEQARRSVALALDRHLQAHDVELVRYDAAALSPEQVARHREAIKLRETVAQSIIALQDEAPTKRGGFDWSIGEAGHGLRDDFDADYALLVVLRDGHSSSGRQAMNALSVLVGAATGFGPPIVTGKQSGWATLTDLESGRVIWFNRYEDTGPTADLRTGPGAEDAVETLLKECPI